MYPGMSSLRPEIKADGFFIKRGAYFFYLKEIGEDSISELTFEKSKTTIKKIICTYPVCSTIIYSIKNV